MNVMLDIETISSRNNAAIVSIGAVAFNPYTIDTRDSITEERKFYTNVDLRTQRGRDFDGDTFYWWLGLPEAARKVVTFNQQSLAAALDSFAAWYASVGGEETWAFGATFDHTIVQDAYNSLGRKNPVHYRKQFCMRTMVKLSSVPCPDIPGLVDHNALDDCIRQTIWLQHALAELRKRTQ